jgi:hypothetical protein
MLHELDLVRMAVVRLVVDVPEGVRDLRADVLPERAAERDVDQLRAAANAEHRLCWITHSHNRSISYRSRTRSPDHSGAAAPR